MTELRIPDQPHRDQAIDPSASVLLRAPAGSGKTGVLLLRFLNCLLTVEQPEAVVAITFTRKAAAEIRERIVHALHLADTQAGGYEGQLAELAARVRERDQALGWQLLQNPSRLRISTFDSFCARIARRLPLLSGLGQIATTDDPDALYREAIFSLFSRLEDGDNALSQALGNVLDYANNRLEQLLPLLSNLLAKRDQWVEGIMADRLDAMEAALADAVMDEYQSIATTLADCDLQTVIQAVCEHSAIEESLSWAADLRHLSEPAPENLEAHAQLASLLLTNSGTLRKNVDKRSGFAPKQAATETLKHWLKTANDSPQLETLTVNLNRLAGLPSPQLPEASRALIGDLVLVLKNLLAELHVVFNDRGVLDFPEVAFRAIGALQPLPDTAGVYGDALLQEDRIQHMLVDEMQDTSVNQIVLLQYLMQGWEPGDGRSLFLCGDLQQSIYLFRGALVGEFERLLEMGHFNGHPLRQLQLEANFRSAPALVNWVNRAFESVFGGGYTPAIAQRADEGRVAVHPLIGDRLNARPAEAEQIVTLVQQAEAENPEGSIAILVRSRSHLQAIVPALKAAGIAFAGQDIDKLASQPAVADYLGLLRAWWHRADRASWMALLRAPFVGLSWDDCWVLANAAPDLSLSDLVLHFEQYRERFVGDFALSNDGLSRVQWLSTVWFEIASQARSVDCRWAIPALWHSLGGPACVDEVERRNIERVHGLLVAHAPAGILNDWQEFSRALDKLYAEPAPARLEIMTIHKSKGLEFDTVILPGLGESASNSDAPLFHWRRLNDELVIAPRAPRRGDAEAECFYDYLKAQQKRDSERELDRLLYVALTRARRQLHLLGVAKPDAKDELRPASGSMLARLWPRVSYLFDGAEPLPEVVADNTLQVPRAPRLSAPPRIVLHRQWQGPQESETPIDRLARQERQAVLEANIEERCVGLVYHELMRRLAARGESAEQLFRAVPTRLRHYCHPEAGLEQSAAHVCELVENTLSCEQGRWILKHYATSGAEQALRRQLGDRWQKLIVDRFFVDGDTCWIIDYKTARGSGEAFLASQRERYGEKMQTYRETLAEALSVEKVRAGLYLPACQALVEC
ncbi:ATP-dependent exoDNAse (exonuclease V) beta subunit [Litorivivens lipolytica]|uniref:DNA 3'-5' helicase n=1 Tax=Litorivivens lipolytica TaxID=1524264 RepID=A0A7W4W713_9GAMM|nr:UvrD-helicase domain-containing protein [Litorivivens lipolytica]MBB3048580.1 ATP-dependent exoDNAse (exonuclease V) beta subunit [Litorivivens lipolytica]